MPRCFLVLLRHLRYFTQPVWSWVALVQPFGMYAGFAMVAGLLGLWARRILVPRIRYISAPSDHLMLALIVAIGLSGLGMKFVAHTDIVALKAFFLGLMRFELNPLPAGSAAAHPHRARCGADDHLSVLQAAAWRRGCSSARRATRSTTRASGGIWPPGRRSSRRELARNEHAHLSPHAARMTPPPMISTSPMAAVPGRHFARHVREALHNGGRTWLR